MKYSVLVYVDASKTVNVEASTPQEAAEKAYELVGTPSICHQCSDEIEIGEPYQATVFDEDCDEELYDDSKPAIATKHPIEIECYADGDWVATYKGKRREGIDCFALGDDPVSAVLELLRLSRGKPEP